MKLKLRKTLLFKQLSLKKKLLQLMMAAFPHIKSLETNCFNDTYPDVEAIYNYIAIQLQAPENAIGQYNRIAGTIEGLNEFPKRVRLLILIT